MANKFCNDENTVYVEYCRSCDSHSWCTHHDESKYHDTFLKLTEMLASSLPQLEIVGNMVPSHLIPFKIAENKYIDSNTNKYVIFPHIGAFEIIFRGKLLFSKKDTHTWPSLPAMLSKIRSVYDPTFQSPPKASATCQKADTSPSNSNLFAGQEEQKATKYKNQQKGFTLTDHFKMYRPKNTFQDKQWLTEKYQSEASMRQISEMGRLDSRQRSDRSSQLKKTPNDLSGEYKLKEMLKTKGKVANDHGKKQMIIRLDSIEEQNLLEQGAGVTHRTPDKSVKRKKMKEIDEQIDSLEKKFKNFENRVHDIHNKNKEFEEKAGSGEIEGEQKNHFRQIIQNKREEKERNSSTKNQKERQLKPAIFLADKTNKLEQYLNYSEQQKNDKLHRIYGEWKLIKQGSSKNKKLLKAKKQKSREQEHEQPSSSSSEDVSYSQSPSTAANIIPFKQNNEKIMQKRIKDIQKKLPKYSSIQRYNKGSDFITKVHNQTEDNFYKGKNAQKNQDSGFDGQISSQPSNVTKLIKKSINTMSMDALKLLSHPSVARLEGEGQQEVLSPAAKANIGTINKRMNIIQERLKEHKAKGLPSQEGDHFLKDRSTSKKSRSDSESQMHQKFYNLQKINPKTNLRYSNASINTVKKNSSQQKSKGSNFSQLARPETKKMKTHNKESIGSIRQQKQEWAKPHQGKRKEAKYVENSDNDHLFDKMLKKNSVNSQSKLNLLREKIRKAKKEHEQTKKSDEDAHGYDRDSSEEEQGSKGKYEYHPHVGRHSKPKERRFKDWKQSSPVKTILKSHDLEAKATQEKNNTIQPRSATEKMRISASKLNSGLSQTKDAETKEKVIAGKIKKNQVKRKVPSKFEHNLTTQQREESNRIFSQEQQDQDENQSDLEEGNQLETQGQKQSKQEKFRKTLGYFKVQEMCYLGGQMNQKYHSPQKKAEEQNQNSILLSQNSRTESQVKNNQFKLQNEPSSSEQRVLSNQNSEQSSFTPKGMMVKQAQRQKQQVSQGGWVTESKKSVSSVVSKEGEGFQQQEVKNSLDQQIEMNNRLEREESSPLEQAGHSQVKTEVVVTDLEELPPVRPHTTKQIYSEPSSKQCQIPQQPSSKQCQSLQLQEHNHLQHQQQIVEKEYLGKKKVKAQKSKTNEQKKEEDAAGLVTKEYGFYLASKLSAQMVKQIFVNSTVAVQPEQFSSNSQQIPTQNTEIACFNDFKQEEQKVNEEDQDQEDYQTEEVEKINRHYSQNVSPNIAQKHEERVDEALKPSSTPSQQSNQSPMQQQPSRIAILPMVQSNLTAALQTPKPSSALNSNKNTVDSLKVDSNGSKETSLQAKQQSNNVYADAKGQLTQASKFVEMGVQKQLTLQVSIQTDTVFAPAEERKPESKRSTRREASQIRESPDSPAEFEGTARNNYLQDTKISFGREKKEILRAAITQQIRSSNRAKQMDKFQGVISNLEFHSAQEAQTSVRMGDLYPQGVFINERSLEVELIKTRFHNLMKVLEIIAERGEWIITRLFEDPKGVLQEKAFGVWICKNFEWQCFIVNDYIAVDQSNNPLFTFHEGNQKWANVLEKALSSALGGYEQLANADCGEIFTLLTGCNYLGVRIKQDPTKNSKMLQMIGECQRKNYIVHAEKRNSKVNESKERQGIFYLLSVRRSNGQDQALLELSQDGRESFWMRLSKFAQEFTKVQVLQLRVNHTFKHIDINTTKQAQMTVIQLIFSESGQGCVTLSYIDHIAPLYAYLYREEKSKVLKLIGQAKQKQKSHLFFECNFNEGRYFVFVQSKERQTRLSYFGQNEPLMRVTEEIHNEGLKNEVAEYLPVQEQKESRPKKLEMESTWNDWKYGKTPRLKDNFMQSRLREDFVEYILNHNRRKQAEP